MVAKHTWLHRNYGKPGQCENRENKFLDFTCNEISKRYAYALKHEKQYSKDINDYYILCYSCHKKYDFQKGWKGSSTSFKKGTIPWTTGKKKINGEYIKIKL